MSAVLDHHGKAHDHAHDDHHAPSGWRRWVFATNHKDIGTMYLLFAFTMLMFGGVLALGIRAELFQPGLQYVNPQLFNQLTTMHGLIMVFGAIMPAFVGFANWMIPLQIGAGDMAFARMNNFSFWLMIPRRHHAGRQLLHAGRGTGRRLDALRAADPADGPVDGRRHLRDAHPRRELHHGFDQHHRHHPEHARAGHDADEDAPA
jgi:hypothetical protein